MHIEGHDPRIIDRLLRSVTVDDTLEGGASNRIAAQLNVPLSDVEGARVALLETLENAADAAENVQAQVGAHLQATTSRSGQVGHGGTRLNSPKFDLSDWNSPGQQGSDPKSWDAVDLSKLSLGRASVPVRNGQLEVTQQGDLVSVRVPSDGALMRVHRAEIAQLLFGIEPMLKGKSLIFDARGGRTGALEADPETVARFVAQAIDLLDHATDGQFQVLLTSEAAEAARAFLQPSHADRIIEEPSMMRTT